MEVIHPGTGPTDEGTLSHDHREHLNDEDLDAAPDGVGRGVPIVERVVFLSPRHHRDPFQSVDRRQV